MLLAAECNWPTVFIHHAQRVWAPTEVALAAQMVLALDQPMAQALQQFRDAEIRG